MPAVPQKALVPVPPLAPARQARVKEPLEHQAQKNVRVSLLYFHTQAFLFLGRGRRKELLMKGGLMKVENGKLACLPHL